MLDYELVQLNHTYTQHLMYTASTINAVSVGLCRINKDRTRLSFNKVCSRIVLHVCVLELCSNRFDVVERYQESILLYSTALMNTSVSRHIIVLNTFVTVQ